MSGQLETSFYQRPRELFEKGGLESEGKDNTKQTNELLLSRAQKSGKDGEDSSWTEPNLMDSLVTKQGIKQTDRQKDRDTDSQTER